METIDVFELARLGSTRQGRIDIADLPRLADSLAKRQASISYRCQGLIDASARPALNLTIEAVLPLRCDRCGGELDLPVRAQKSFFFVSTEADLAAIPIDDSPDEALLGSRHFDLCGLIEDEAILHLPISPRHERCEAAGIAPAPAAAAERRQPFAQLAQLRDRLRAVAGPARRTRRDSKGPRPAAGARKVRGRPS